MAFRWPADCGPTLNADFVALRVLVSSEPVLLRNPIVLWFPMGPHPSPFGSAHECTATLFTLIDDIPSMWHSSTNKSHVSNIYESRGGEWGSRHPKYTNTHTRTRASWQITGMYVCLGIQVLTPPTIQKAAQPAFFRPPAKHLVPSPWSNNLDPRMQLF